jgi:hypothetical protein
MCYNLKKNMLISKSYILKYIDKKTLRAEIYVWKGQFGIQYRAHTK